MNLNSLSFLDAGRGALILQRVMKRAVFAVFLIGLFPVFGQEPPNFDVIIKGGTVYDGTGAEPRHVDVAIRGDRIAGIGDFKTA